VHMETVRANDGTSGHDESLELLESMNTWQECMKIRTNCVDLRTLGKSE